MVLKCSYISQKIKWERALGNPIASIVKPILICVHSHPHDGLTLRIKRYELFTWMKLDMSIVGETTAMVGLFTW